MMWFPSCYLYINAYVTKSVFYLAVKEWGCLKIVVL